MAEQDIVERLREVNITRYDEAGEGHVGPCMVEHRNGDYVQHSDHLAVVDNLIAENTSLRQQLADARETAGGALAPFVAAFEKARVGYSKRYADNDLGRANFDKMPDDWSMDRLTFNMGQYRAAVAAARALPHHDREGDRTSETETAARIVDTQAQYYAGHNDDIAKALREAAGAIRAQSQPRPRREGERG